MSKPTHIWTGASWLSAMNKPTHIDKSPNERMQAFIRRCSQAVEDAVKDGFVGLRTMAARTSNDADMFRDAPAVAVWFAESEDPHVLSCLEMQLVVNACEPFLPKLRADDRELIDAMLRLFREAASLAEQVYREGLEAEARH